MHRAGRAATACSVRPGIRYHARTHAQGNHKKVTEASEHCHGRLQPITTPADSSASLIRYASSDTLLVLGPTQEQLAVLAKFGWSGAVVIVSADDAQARVDQKVGASRTIVGTAHELNGWLGRFQILASDPHGNALTSLSPNPSGRFDLIIDCYETPLLDSPVTPFGYFRTETPTEMQDALSAARQLIGNFAKPKYFDYQLGLCAHHSYGQSGCTRCLDVCGADAIRSGGHQIEINPYLCQGCGSCTLACPTGALTFVAPDRDALLNELRDWAPRPDTGKAARTLLVSDGPLVEADAGQQTFLKVEPLTAFGEELWVAALALGFDRVVLQPTAALEPRTRALLDQKLDDFHRMLPALGFSESAVILLDPEFEQPEAASTAELVPPGRATQASMLENPPSRQSKRQFLNVVLQALQPAAEREQTPTLNEGAPLGEILVDQDRCTLCSSCAKLCPTGAIDYSEREQPGTARLTFLESSCVQCGICVSGCPEQAITLAPRLAAEEIRTQRRAVASSPMAGCVDCGAQFAAQTLLDATVRRLSENNATEAALEQTVRCPRCRAARVG